MTDSLTGQRRIDAHHHVWDLGVRDQPWTAGLPSLRRTFTIDELVPHLVRHRIDGSVVVQTVCTPDETPELLRLAAVDDHVLGAVVWVDLTADDVADRLAALRAGFGGETLVGVRHQVQQEDPGWLTRDDVRRGLAAVATAGLAYDLIVTSDQLPAAIETAQALPQLALVLDHAGKPPIRAGHLEPWASDVEALARCPNTTVKLSGLATEADPDYWTAAELRPYVDVVLGAFGPARTMFGSDWPVCLLAGGYDAVIDATEELLAALSAAERAAIFGGTAERVYGLDVL